MKSSELTKMALTGCLVMIATGASSWLVFGQDKVTRPDMQEYVQEKLVPMERLERSVEKLVTTQTELLVEQRVLVERLNLFLETR